MQGGDLGTLQRKINGGLSQSNSDVQQFLAVQGTNALQDELVLQSRRSFKARVHPDVLHGSGVRPLIMETGFALLNLLSLHRTAAFSCSFPNRARERRWPVAAQSSPPDSASRTRCRAGVLSFPQRSGPRNRPQVRSQPVWSRKRTSPDKSVRSNLGPQSARPGPYTRYIAST